MKNTTHFTPDTQRVENTNMQTITSHDEDAAYAPNPSSQFQMHGIKRQSNSFKESETRRNQLS
jgi:hypothetical protein